MWFPKGISGTKANSTQVKERQVTAPRAGPSPAAEDN